MKRSYTTPASSGGSKKKKTPYSGKLVKRSRLTQNFPVRSISSNPTGFPKQLVIKHKYVDHNLAITSTTGSMGTYVFSCNGLFDPNITATGSQPLYFDQLAAIYQHYNVIGSRIKFKVQIPGQVASLMGEVLAYIEDNATPSTTFKQAAEQASATRTKFVFGNGQDAAELWLTWSAKQNFGPNAIDNVQLQGTPSVNPNEQQYFVLCFQALNAQSTSAYFTAEIEYIAVWRELKDITTS